MSHKKNYILAIDLGTSGPKIAIFSIAGEVIASTARDTSLLLTDDGGVEQDPRLWWELIKDGIHELLDAHPTLRPHIVAIAATAQWAGTVALGHNGTPLMNSIIWMDARGADATRRLCRGPLAIEGYGINKLAQWIYKTAGGPILSGKDPLGHILFIKERYPELYAATKVFLEPKDYLNFLLSGRVASSLDTMALHWVTNNRRLQDPPRYDAGLLRLTGLDENKLPPLLLSTDILGPIRRELASEFSLSPDTKVVVSSPDVPAAAVGSGAIADYQAHLCIGTSSWLTCHVPFKKTSFASKIATLPSAIPGRYFVVNEQESAGYCLHYLRSLLAGSSSTASEWSFAAMEEAAREAPPGSKALIFTPWINGERTPVDDHHLRGGFHNLGLPHQRGDLIRAVYEGVAYNSKWLLQTVERFIARPITSLHLIGGGAQSRLWCQIFADVLGCEIKQVRNPRAANARGAAWLAAAGLGLISFAEMQHHISFAEIFTPNPRHRAMYARQFGEFMRIYPNNKKMHHRLQN
jgi:xylulokinase